MATVGTLAPAFNMAPPEADDMMEFSTEGDSNLHQDDEIDIDIDIEGGTAEHHEDEDMVGGQDDVHGAADDEMVDDEIFPEDEIIEDIDDYDHNPAQELFVNDEELRDAEEPEIQPLHSDLQDDHQTAASAVPTDTNQPLSNEQTLEPVADAQASTANESRVQQSEDVIQLPQPALDAVEYVELSEDTLEATDPTVASTHPEPSLSEIEEKCRDVDPTEQVDEGLAFDDTLEEEDYDELDGNVEEHHAESHSHTASNEILLASEKVDPTAEAHQDGTVPEALTNEEQDLYTAEDDGFHREQRAQVEHTNGQVAETDDSESHFTHKVFVQYQDMEMSLFPPQDRHDGSQTYLLAEHALANETVRTLLNSCRLVLGESCDESEDLEMIIPSLDLVFTETTEFSSTLSLAHLASINLQLQHNDGIEDLQPLSLVLQTRQKTSHRLQYLYSAISEGKGLSHLHPSTPVTDPPGTELFDNDEAHDDQPFEVPEPDASSTVLHEENVRPNTPSNTDLARPKDVGDDSIDFRSPTRLQKDAITLHNKESGSSVAALHEPSSFEEDEDVGQSPTATALIHDEGEGSQSSATLQEAAAQISTNHTAIGEDSSQPGNDLAGDDLDEGQDLHTGSHTEVETSQENLNAQAAAIGEEFTNQNDPLDHDTYQELNTNLQSPFNEHDQGNEPLDRSGEGIEILPKATDSNAPILNLEGSQAPADEIYDHLEESEDSREPYDAAASLDQASLRAEERGPPEANTPGHPEPCPDVSTHDDDELTFEDDEQPGNEEDSEGPAIEVNSALTNEVPPSPGSLKRPWIAEDEIDSSQTSPSDSKRSRPD